MSASMNKILLVGATGGIGEAAARRFHSMNKKLILTGRRTARLEELKKELPGTDIYTFDMSDLSSLSGHIETLFAKHADIDTVWINGGIQRLVSLKEPSPGAVQDIVLEMNTNLTAPVIIAHTVLPKFHKSGKESTFMVTSSGIAFSPAAFAPGYSATKGGIHAFMVTLRQNFKGSNVNIIEIVPPYVKTELDKDTRETHPLLSKLTPMPLEDFTNEIFEQLDNNAAKDLKEVAAGTAKGRVDIWRNSTGKALAAANMGD